jgi:ABC-type Fe3+-hydroxamate transport system substrate-binding protein
MIMEANCTTGEIVEREKNAEELAQSTKDQAAEAARKAAEAAKSAEKAAVLAKLGLTADEVAALLS